MSESNNNQPDDASELVTLRKVNAELLTTKHALKARITALESEVAQATEKAGKADAKLRAIIVDEPLKQLAGEMSIAPSIFIRELLSDYKIEPREDGSLALLDKDGKPVTLDTDKPLSLSQADLKRLLITPNKLVSTERQKEFSALILVGRGSGGIGSGKLASRGIDLGDKKVDKPVATVYGLR